MSGDYVISQAARSDILILLNWTRDKFGDLATNRYLALLEQAMSDVADDPNRRGSEKRPEVAPRSRIFHLQHSRNRVAARLGRVRRPRHFLLYGVRQDGAVEISRVLHDQMDLTRFAAEPDDET